MLYRLERPVFDDLTIERREAVNIGEFCDMGLYGSGMGLNVGRTWLRCMK